MRIVLYRETDTEEHTVVCVCVRLCTRPHTCSGHGQRTLHSICCPQPFQSQNPTLPPQPSVQPLFWSSKLVTSRKGLVSTPPHMHTTHQVALSLKRICLIHYKICCLITTMCQAWMAQWKLLLREVCFDSPNRTTWTSLTETLIQAEHVRLWI